MLTVVQGCIDCQTPMIDMEKWGNCPNCSSRNIGPVTFAKEAPPEPKVVPKLRFYELKFNDGNLQETVIYVRAKNTTDARMMLYLWCEREGKLILSSMGTDIRFLPRTSKNERSNLGKTLTGEIDAHLYRIEPDQYLTHNSQGRVVRKHLIAA